MTRRDFVLATLALSLWPLRTKAKAKAKSAAHNAPTECTINIKTGEVFVKHIRDNEKVYLAVDGVAAGRVYRGQSWLPTGTKKAYVYNAAGTWFCSGGY